MIMGSGIWGDLLQWSISSLCLVYHAPDKLEGAIAHGGSADYLEMITRPARYVLVERGASGDLLRDDVIMIKDADGSGGVDMPSAIFDEFRARAFLRQDRPEDDQGRAVFLASQNAYSAHNASK